MLNQAIQQENFSPEVIKYIKELETNYTQRINELETNYIQRINELETNHKQNYQQLYNEHLILQDKYDLLVYKRFVRSAEQLLADERQPLLFTEEAGQHEAKEDAPQEYETITFTRKKGGGRKPLSANFERRERIIDIPESEKTCACGAVLTRIGEEISEKLVMIPMQVYVEQTVRPKYACRQCEGTEEEDKPTVRIAPVEPAIIPKSIASPSLLAVIFTQKFEMHLPYYRQEKQFAQIEVIISRQDMANWQQQAYAFLKPLFDLLEVMIKMGPVMRMDETSVQVIGEEGREDTQTSYMWLALGGPPDKKVAWYEYHPTRAAYNAREFLQGYSGYLQTDGYEGYDCAVKDMPGIIHAGCFAHSRRRFFEAAKINKKPQSAEEGIKYIRKLYQLEDALRSKWKDDLEKFQEERKKEAVPILNEFKEWLLKRANEVLPKTLLGEAINYTLNQWDKLIKYIESPYLTPDNNASENAIRPFVLGRKNWLFCQSVGGAKSSCGMYSLIETAKLNGLVSRKYLTALFEKAPYATTLEDWEKLLPWNIKLPV
jgi:transposase